MKNCLKISAEKLSREIVIACFATIVVAGIAYATATIPPACTTPGDCADITPTFQSVNIGSSTAIDNETFTFNGSLPTSTIDTAIEAGPDAIGFSGFEGVGFSTRDSANDVFTTVFIGDSPIGAFTSIGMIDQTLATDFRGSFDIHDTGASQPYAQIHIGGTFTNPANSINVTADDIQLGANLNSPQARIDHGTGNFGIGTGMTALIEKLEIVGAVKIADTVSACSAASAGTIRFNGTEFFGCDGTAWEQISP